MRRAIAQFSRYRVEISQVRQRLHVKSRVEVDDSTVPQKGVGNKGLTTQKTSIQSAYREFSRYEVETSQVRQRLYGTDRGAG